MVTKQNDNRPFWRKKRWRVLIGLPIIIFLLYRFLFPTYSWNEKITVTIETPNGEVSGFAVRQVKVKAQAALLPQISGVDLRVRGEAVVVDMPDGKYLFALLGPPAGHAPSAYQAKYPDQRRSILYYAKRISILYPEGAIEILPEQYPRLVTFEDVKVSETVKQVDPNDLDGVFGCDMNSESKPWREVGLTWREWRQYQVSGLSLEEFSKAKPRFSPSSNLPDFTSEKRRAVINIPHRKDTSSDCYRLKSITVELTNERVTQTPIENVLPWLPEYYGKMLDGSRTRSYRAENDFANSLDFGNFKGSK